jgi:hypothetical protein
MRGSLGGWVLMETVEPGRLVSSEAQREGGRLWEGV